MFSFERMIAWQKAAEWSDRVFDIADSLPQRLQYSFGEQLRRACLSVTNNLAEGSGKRTPSSQRNFYDISHGSIYESVSIMAMLRRRSLIDANQYEAAYLKADEIASLIYGLIQAATAAEVKAKTLRESEPDYKVGNDG